MIIISIPQAENKPEILNLHDRVTITLRSRILGGFVSEIERSQQVLPPEYPEYDELVDEHFWELA